MPTPNSAETLFRGTALAGLAVLALFVLLPPGTENPYFGHDLYDAYYRALLEGRWQLSAKVLGVEGHYLADGRGFTYYGLAPLIPRFLLGWLLPTDGSVFPLLTIFLFTGAGSIMLHRIVHERAVAAGASSMLLVLFAGMVWLAGPMPIIAANHAVYHEPIAVGFAAISGFLYAVHRKSVGRGSLGSVLVLGSLCAALALHARPHVAIAICAGLAVVGIAGIVRRERWLVASIAGVLIIGASAAGYLAANHAKFGDATAAHGEFAEDAKLRYGTAFLKYEHPRSERARGFEEHGRFNAKRIPTHFLAHHVLMADAPSSDLGMGAVAWSEQFHGHSRFEGPHMGMLFLFAPWYMVVLLGLRRGKWSVENGAMVAATGVLFLLMLSYPTITFRYRVELFMFPFVLACLSIPRFVTRTMSAKSDVVRRLPLFVLALGAFMTLFASNWSRQLFPEAGLFHRMDDAECLERLGMAGVTATQAEASCNP
ncbi:hypothetical protein WJT74_03050 [Sphingomicrobium sp. XHP0239]|uniref:hypothetical protein n=1 Tax=Sphingomicrobium maritimum TaxID=3133972 RepID=UPI0031CC6F26